MVQRNIPNQTDTDVIPLLDSAPHWLGMGCHCKPRIDAHNIVHNSFDRREEWEKLTGQGIKGKRWGRYHGSAGNYALESYENDR